MKSLDSTEVLIQGASDWMTTGPLPSPTAVLKAATLGRDRLIVCGKSYHMWCLSAPIISALDLHQIILNLWRDYYCNHYLNMVSPPELSASSLTIERVTIKKYLKSCGKIYTFKVRTARKGVSEWTFYILTLWCTQEALWKGGLQTRSWSGFGSPAPLALDRGGSLALCSPSGGIMQWGSSRLKQRKSSETVKNINK